MAFWVPGSSLPYSVPLALSPFLLSEQHLTFGLWSFFRGVFLHLISNPDGGGSVLVKGKSLLDTGYIYAPYVPMQLTPTIINPFNFAPVKGIMTRYAKKCVNNRFYGAVKVDGLVQWDPQEIR